jgi:hypothetical protein
VTSSHESSSSTSSSTLQAPESTKRAQMTAVQYETPRHRNIYCIHPYSDSDLNSLINPDCFIEDVAEEFGLYVTINDLYHGTFESSA